MIIGSQAVLAQFPRAPARLLASMEADLYPRNQPELADLVDGSIGEGSVFHERFGYYAQGVTAQTTTLPDGWESRLISVKNPNTGGVEGLCLEVHDLAISKYVAGREKDLEVTRELARHRMTDPAVLRERLARTRLAATRRKLIEGRIARDFPTIPRKTRRR